MKRFCFQKNLVFLMICQVILAISATSTVWGEDSTASSLRLSTLKTAEVLNQHEQFERPFPQYFHYEHIDEGVRFQADFPLDGVKTLVQETEELEKDLQAYLGLPLRKEMVEVLLFDRETSYLDFLQREFSDAPWDRRALFIKQKGKPGIVLIQLSKGIDDDIRHEMTHAFLHASYRYVPLWLDEGLAEYFELPSTQRADEKPYLKKTLGPLFFASVPSLKKLENITNINEFGAKEYRESWAWVHFMIHNSPETHKILAGYLVHIGTEESQDTQADSVENYLAKVVPDLKKAYIDHFKGWKNRKMVMNSGFSKSRSDAELAEPNENKSKPEGVTRSWGSFFR